MKKYEDDLEAHHARKLICNYLEHYSASNLQDIVESVGMERKVVLRALGKMVDAAEIEVLCPISEYNRNGDRADKTHSMVYYRMVRDTDNYWRLFWNVNRKTGSIKTECLMS